MTKSNADPTAQRIAQEWQDVLARMSEEDKKFLEIFRLMGETIDKRYEMKGIRALVGRALLDPEFRSRVLADADAALAEVRGFLELPDNVQIRCVENSEKSLTIVLPPLPEYPIRMSTKIRDIVFSRTSDNAMMIDPAGVDDDDVMPAFFDIGTGDHDGFHFGDPSRDG